MLHHVESHPLFPLPIVRIDDLAGDSLLFFAPFTVYSSGGDRLLGFPSIH